MNRKLMTVSIVLLISLMAGCTSTGLVHGFIMRGQVVQVDGGKGVVCIGTADGAKVGQLFTAYWVDVEDSLYNDTQEYILRETGKVIIRKIVDEHFAEFEVTEGSVEMRGIIELKK